MKRGDIVVAGEHGSFSGKPRPWLVVQADTFLDDPATVTVCLISTAIEARTFRIPVSPLPDNGLSEASTVLVDKLLTLRESSVDRVIGTLDPASLRRVDEALRMWLAL